jgi:hypothetical protein
VEGRAIETPTADHRAEEEISAPPANDAHVRATPGGVGAVRRTVRRRGRRPPPLAFGLVLFLFACGGAGSPVGYAPPLWADLIPASRFERAARTDRAEAHSRTLSSLADLASDSGAGPAATSPPATPPASAAPPAAPKPFDRPIVAPPSFSSRPSRPARPPRALVAPSGPKEGGVWAVVVGIDDYPGHEGDLRAASADARDVDAALAAYGVPAHRRILLLDGQASGANIRSSLGWLVAHASTDATAVFFYSGHVRQVSGSTDGDREGLDEALVGSDGAPVLDGEMAELLSGLEARAAWLGIAGCYGSGFDDALAPGRLITAAAAEADLAYENSALGHSYLVEYMVRQAMLQGKAPGSVQEAFGWAQSQIARDYPNRQPVMIDRTRGPLVLEAQARPRGAAPAEPQRPAPPESQSAPEQAPAPPPSPPAESPGEGSPGEGACASVLGVTVCSNNRSSLTLAAVAAPSAETGWRRAP